MENEIASFSNSQIDRLGERLKLGGTSDEDVEMLSSYRNSFAAAANSGAQVVRELSGLEVTVRSLKTTLSIVAKLRREGVRQLSAMQDIGGCRVTVDTLIVQNELIEKLMIAFPDAKLYDRVKKPSHGYRAKHLVVKVDGRRIEIQVRTRFQNLWALFSECAADLFGQEIKYGKGPSNVLSILSAMSKRYEFFDESEVPDEVLNQFELMHEEVRKTLLKNDLLH